MTSRSGSGAAVGTAQKEIGAGIELLAFDLDGTLVDSAPDLNHCLGQALHSVGLARPSEAQTRAFIGDGVEELIRRALTHVARDTAHASPERLFEPAFAAFAACYEKNLYVRSALYPGVAEALHALAAHGFRLCCITNKRVHLADALLEQAGIRGSFELVLGGDSLPEKKPSPMQLHAAADTLRVAASAALFIGDSDHDHGAAAAAGWRFIWAAYGYRRSIDAPGNIISIAAVDELPALLAHGR